MCAIIGFASSAKIEEKKWLRIGRDVMSHRGPDDYGEWWSPDGRVGFGHRRLAIHDLSTDGHQPMLSKDKNIVLIFNGEIYNYKEIRSDLIKKGYIFTSKSDTEVLLYSWEEWGVDCVSYLEGMFAFSIYDSNKKIIFLARDIAGEKPLFYYPSSDGIRFSSELKGLLVDPSFPHHIDESALNCYLSMGYIPGDLCILKGVSKLPPAHFLVFDIDKQSIKIIKYWSPTLADTLPIFSNDEEKVLNKVESLLEDSILKQLDADVSVGILLSGGVDSSLITAIARRISSNVNTYSVGFDQFEEYNELPYAKLISNYFGTNHVELKVDKIDTSLLYEVAKQYDEPMADSSILPTFMISKLVRKHCTVALGGDGADELFGGYHHYSRLLFLKKLTQYVPLFLRQPSSYIFYKFTKIGTKGRAWILAMGLDLKKNLPLIGLFFDSETIAKLLNRKKNNIAGYIFDQRIPSIRDIINRATLMDFNNYLPEDILVKVDRASMLNSLELRSPFLSKGIIEYAFRYIPSRMKANAIQRKIILKKLTKKLLPKDFDRKRKQGFSIPLKEWLYKGEWRVFFEDILLDSSCIFNKDVIQELFDSHDAGGNNQERLFSLVLFELWRREYDIVVK